jgi:hypothetical protein
MRVSIDPANKKAINHPKPMWNFQGYRIPPGGGFLRAGKGRKSIVFSAN